MGLCLPRVLEALLFIRALRAGDAACRLVAQLRQQPDHHDLVQSFVRARELPSGRKRAVPPQVPPRPAADARDRADLDVLSEISFGACLQDRRLGSDLPATAQDLREDKARSATL